MSCDEVNFEFNWSEVTLSFNQFFSRFFPWFYGDLLGSFVAWGIFWHQAEFSCLLIEGVHSWIKAVWYWNCQIRCVFRLFNFYKVTAFNLFKTSHEYRLAWEIRRNNFVLFAFHYKVHLSLIDYKVKMENINKSIIYGNIHQNRYGKFLPICSSINDRSKLSFIQATWPQSWITFTKAFISRNTIESHTPTGWRKSQSFSLQKRKMFNRNITKTATATKRLRDLAKSFFIFLRNSVFSCLISFRCQECLHRMPYSTIQSSFSFLNDQLSSHCLKLKNLAWWAL